MTVELGVRFEQSESAAHAEVRAVLVELDQLARVWLLGSLLPRHMVLLFSQLALPFVVASVRVAHFGIGYSIKKKQQLFFY